MGAHIINGQFQSDKYPWCRPGFVPLKVTDPMAQPELWQYAQTRREVDPEFADDLEMALRAAGYIPPAEVTVHHLRDCNGNPRIDFATPDTRRCKRCGHKGYEHQQSFSLAGLVCPVQVTTFDPE